jgi:hypothetical protein
MAENDVQGKVLQLAMGFGQGAGTMLATEGALLSGVGPYLASIHERSSNWSEYALQAVEYSRAMGSLAAQHALAAGRCVIEESDVQFALAAVQQNTLAPLGVCSLTD